MKSPTPQEIKQARTDAGLTQTQAAHQVHSSLRAWQQWEYAGAYPRSGRKMHPAVWELFLIKRLHPARNERTIDSSAKGLPRSEKE